MLIFRNPDTVAAPIGRYSHSVEIPANARTLMISGQVGLAADGTLPPDYFEQLRNALRNVRLNVEAAGMTTRDIAKCTLLAVESHRPTGPDARMTAATIMNEIFGDHVPAWTTHIISALVRPDLMLEVEAIAAAV
jgi:enamine deaminase RidA (YjgF/YER057c/UK114 family)